MDNSDSNKNKAKNWLYRILKPKNRRHGESSALESTVDLHRGDVENIENPEQSTNCNRTRNSFRRSLKKMHSRVKSCIIPQKPAAIEAPIAVYESRPLESPANSLRILTDEILSLSMHYWYWGPITTAEAEEKLRHKPNGSFLVRDSASTSYLFSISFRTVGKTMHARIEYSKGKYNLSGCFTQGFPTVTELIQDAINISENGVYCYSRGGENCDFPVRLTNPISRYTEVRSLKYLCKFVIRQYTNINDIPKLPLPRVLYSYLLEGPYF